MHHKTSMPLAMRDDDKNQTELYGSLKMACKRSICGAYGPGFGMCGPVPYDIDAINVDAWQSIINTMPEGPCPGKLNTRL